MKFLWIASKKEFNLISIKVVITVQLVIMGYQIKATSQIETQVRIIMIECNCGCTFNESDNTFDFILIICPDCAQEYETDNDAPCAGELEYENQCYD
jgi:hypothetical protein